MQNSPGMYDELSIKCARTKMEARYQKLLAVSLVLNFDVTVRVASARIVMGPVDDTAARIEFVFAAHDDRFARDDREASREVDVRFDTDRQTAPTRAGKMQEEAFVGAGPADAGP